jgi:L-aspartate semialdehyde sulfurtransferase ferredoxin
MITKKICLFFPKSEIEKPIIYHLVKDYDLIINIFRAKITAEEEGYLVIDVKGTEENIEKAMEYMKESDVILNESNRGLQRDKDKCVHCGNCVAHCPTRALYIENERTRKVAFNEDVCIECLACVRNCPFGACFSIF